MMFRLLVLLLAFHLSFGPALAYSNVNPTRGWLSARKLSQRDLNPVGNCTVSIGTPALVGNGGANVSTSLTFNLSAAISSGDFLILVTSTINTTSTISSVSIGTNTLKKLARTTIDGGQTVEYWYLENVAAVSNGSTVTISLSSGTWMAAYMYRVTGLATSNGGDVFVANGGGGTSNTGVSSGALSQNNELLFSSISVLNGGGNLNTFGNLGGFTNLVSGSDGTNRANIALFYQTVSSNASVTFAPTWSQTGSPSNSTVAIGSFKAPC